MPEHFTQFEATPGGLVLASAILLYRGEGAVGGNYNAGHEGATAFASIHPVDEIEGKPTIGVGAPLTRAHLRQWAAALGRNAAPEILPGNVFVSHPDMLAWWVPEQVRTGYFALSQPPKDMKALSKRCSVPVPYPAHVFVATSGGLGVYALAKSERPGAGTPLLCSPVLNVFASGQLCWGNVRKPKSPAIASMPDYESAVFDSWSTHPNPGQELSVSGKGGLVRLWDDLAARKAKRFPAGRLRPFTGARGRSGRAEPMTLGMLISGKAQA